MKLEHLLLGTLLQHPATGYDLKKFLDVTGRFWRPNTAMTQVYRSLRKLEAHGLLQHSVEERPGAQDAKRYHVTEKGVDVFMRWLARTDWPAEMAGMGSPEFWPRLRFCASFVGIEAVLEVLELELDARRKQRQRFRDRDRAETIAPTVPFDMALTGVIMDFQHAAGAAVVDEHIRRCEQLHERLSSQPIDPGFGDLLLRHDQPEDAVRGV